MSDKNIFYLCDRKKCPACKDDGECHLTADITHAAFFQKDEFGNYVQMSIPPTVIGIDWASKQNENCPVCNCPIGEITSILQPWQKNFCKVCGLPLNDREDCDCEKPTWGLGPK